MEKYFRLDTEFIFIKNLYKNKKAAYEEDKPVRTWSHCSCVHSSMLRGHWQNCVPVRALAGSRVVPTSSLSLGMMSDVSVHCSEANCRRNSAISKYGAHRNHCNCGSTLLVARCNWAVAPPYQHAKFDFYVEGHYCIALDQNGKLSATLLKEKAARAPTMFSSCTAFFYNCICLRWCKCTASKTKMISQAAFCGSKVIICNLFVNRLQTITCWCRFCQKCYWREPPCTDVVGSNTVISLHY